MTPGQAQWAMFAFGAVCSWVIMSIIGVPAIAVLFSLLHRNEHIRLRVALGDLVRAVEADARFRDAFAIKNSVRRARDVLRGKGAE